MTAQELELQEKQALDTKEEQTRAGTFYQPYTDIHESNDAVIVSMDMPGVGKDNIEVELERDVLTITGKVDFKPYDGLKPVYTEYNVGHFSRRFTISNAVDKDAISAAIDAGVLTITLPKIKQAVSRRIEVS